MLPLDLLQPAESLPLLDLSRAPGSLGLDFGLPGLLLAVGWVVELGSGMPGLPMSLGSLGLDSLLPLDLLLLLD